MGSVFHSLARQTDGRFSEKQREMYACSAFVSDKWSGQTGSGVNHSTSRPLHEDPSRTCPFLSRFFPHQSALSVAFTAAHCTIPLSARQRNSLHSSATTCFTTYSGRTTGTKVKRRTTSFATWFTTGTTTNSTSMMTNTKATVIMTLIRISATINN